MKYLIYSISLLILISCSEIESTTYKESCDYPICEEGRLNVDTIRNFYGVFRSNLDCDYIEITTGGYTPDTFFIVCHEPDLTIPPNNSYVKFSGHTKQICSINDPMIQKDSLYLIDIEEIVPEELYDCATAIHNDGIDSDLIDAKLNILNITVDKNCISILISYVGMCNLDPIFTLNNSGDILFGGEKSFIMAVQGLIEDDCSTESIKLLKFDLSSLGEIVPIREDEFFVLFFQRQGYLRILYPHTYN